MTGDPDMADDLGPCHYGESGRIPPAIVYTCCGVAFLMFGIFGTMLPPDPKVPPHTFLRAGLFMAGVGAVGLVIGLVRLVPNPGASWHLHEQGVRVVRRGDQRVLANQDVDEVSLNAVRVFVNGVCTGDVQVATFTSGRVGRPMVIKQVRRPSTISGVELDKSSELAEACNKVADLIAARMAAQLERGGSIAWVQSIRIHADGLDDESSAAVGARIPWNRIGRLTIEDGHFLLWRKGKSQSALSAPVHLPNFLPGYRLIQSRLHAMSEADGMTPTPV